MCLRNGAAWERWGLNFGGNFQFFCALGRGVFVGCVSFGLDPVGEFQRRRAVYAGKNGECFFCL